MKLYEFLRVVQATQQVYLYVHNCQERFVPIGSGEREDVTNDPEVDLLWHIDDTVFQVLPSRIDDGFVIILHDANYNKPLEEQYSELSVSRWDYKDPSTRPWRTWFEIESSSIRAKKKGEK